MCVKTALPIDVLSIVLRRCEMQCRTLKKREYGNRTSNASDISSRIFRIFGFLVSIIVHYIPLKTMYSSYTTVDIEIVPVVAGYCQLNIVAAKFLNLKKAITGGTFY